MQKFIHLFEELDQTQSTNQKLALLKEYFSTEDEKNLSFAVHLLIGKKRKQLLPSKTIKELLFEKTGIDFWVFQECYNEVGDLAETIHLLLPEAKHVSETDLKKDYLTLSGFNNEVQKKDYVRHCWEKYTSTSRFLFNKIIAGSLRIGISEGLVFRALAESFNLSIHHVTKSLMGNWDPLEGQFKILLDGKNQLKDISAPYPFCLAHSLEKPLAEDELSNWQIEKKWDGIRCQIIKRENEVFIWSRGEELVNEQFPELVEAFASLPNGTVLDGELLPYLGDFKIESFNSLQKRLNRKQPSKKIIQETPCMVMAYDLLEHNEQAITETPLKERRKILEQIVTSVGLSCLQISKVYHCENWAEAEKLRAESALDSSEGLMLKNKASFYVAGRKTNVWLKWKSAPLTIDAVLIYAQKGHGKRSGQFTDFTFGLWKEGVIVPFAKAYSGLDNKEITSLNQWINQNTLEKFGPVRTVKAEMVFEIAFEGINESNRHKSGFAVRFPRIARWRKDKTINEANSIDDLKAMMKASIV